MSKDPEERFVAAIGAALDQWFPAATRGRCFLAFKPYGEEFRVIGESDELPDGWELVTGQEMPRNTDRMGVYHWMYRLCRKVPFYALLAVELEQ